MADENNSENAETALGAEVAPPKKRADGKAPAKVHAASRTKATNIAKGTGKNRAARQTTDTSATASVLDGIAVLLQLEEENAQLRKALAEKLRAENADLCKRLGLA